MIIAYKKWSFTFGKDDNVIKKVEIADDYLARKYPEVKNWDHATTKEYVKKVLESWGIKGVFWVSIVPEGLEDEQNQFVNN